MRRARPSSDSVSATSAVALCFRPAATDSTSARSAGLLVAASCAMRCVDVLSQLPLDLFVLRDAAGLVVGEIVRLHSDLLRPS